MKHKVFFGIAIRIVLLFGIGMLGTFVPENAHDFFGDKPCAIQPDGSKDCDNHTIYGGDDLDWGARHYWWTWMCVILFIFSFINLIWSAVNMFKKHHSEIKI